MRGDALEGTRPFRPPGGLQISGPAGHESMSGEWAFVPRVPANEIFVLCLSRVQSTQVAERFECDASVEIKDSQALLPAGSRGREGTLRACNHHSGPRLVLCRVERTRHCVGQSSCARHVEARELLLASGVSLRLRSARVPQAGRNESGPDERNPYGTCRNHLRCSSRRRGRPPRHSEGASSCCLRMETPRRPREGAPVPCKWATRGGRACHSATSR